jgi:hypothetical protein
MRPPGNHFFKQPVRGGGSAGGGSGTTVFAETLGNAYSTTSPGLRRFLPDSPPCLLSPKCCVSEQIGRADFPNALADALQLRPGALIPEAVTLLEPVPTAAPFT